MNICQGSKFLYGEVALNEFQIDQFGQVETALVQKII